MSIENEILTLKSAIRKAKQEMKVAEEDDDEPELPLPQPTKLQKLRKMLEKQKKIKREDKDIKYEVNLQEMP